MPFISLLFREKRGVNTFSGTVWLAKDDKTTRLLLVNGRQSYTAYRNDPNKRIEIEITLESKCDSLF